MKSGIQPCEIFILGGLRGWLQQQGQQIRIEFIPGDGEDMVPVGGRVQGGDDDRGEDGDGAEGEGGERVTTVMLIRWSKGYGGWVPPYR